jgi:hypothetical protein
MVFDSSHGAAEEMGDLLVAFAFDDELKDFFLGSSENLGQSAFPGFVDFQSGFDDGQECRFVQRFFDIIQSAGFDGLDGNGNFAETGDNEDGHERTNDFSLFEQFDAVHSGHVDIGDEEVTVLCFQSLDAIGGIGKAGDPAGYFLKRDADRFSDRRFIIDKKDDFRTS